MTVHPAFLARRTASVASVSVPIWFTLSSRPLQFLPAMAWVTDSGLVHLGGGGGGDRRARTQGWCMVHPGGGHKGEGSHGRHGAAGGGRESWSVRCSWRGQGVMVGAVQLEVVRGCGGGRDWLVLGVLNVCGGAGTGLVLGELNVCLRGRGGRGGKGGKGAGREGGEGRDSGSAHLRGRGGYLSLMSTDEW